MNSFYRYIRPLKFIERRIELETLPRGGICLRFQEEAEGGLSFTHARCHTDELFSKAVAKRICDDRSASQKHWAFDKPTVPYNTNAVILVQDVIATAETWNPSVAKDMAAVATYLKLEMRELSSCLDRLVSSNGREVAKADIWKFGLGAAGFINQYAKAARAHRY